MPGASLSGAFATLHHPLSRLFALAIRVPPLLLLDPRIDVDVLGLLDRLEPPPPKPPAAAAPAVAAEGGGVVVREGIVDPDRAGPDAPRAPEHLLEVLRVHVRPKPERHGVREPDGLVERIDLDHRQHGPEGLLAHDPHRMLDTGQDRRPVEEAPPAEALAARDELRATVQGLPDVVLYLVPALRVDHGPDVRLGVHRVADVERLRELLRSLDEVVRHLLVHVEALRRGADLPGVQARRPYGALGRYLHVHIVADDEGVLAAELEVRPHQALRGGNADLAARLLAARERDHVHVRVP